MDKNTEKLGQLVKSARSVDARSVNLDEDFKNNLRENLYNEYINYQNKGGSIMERLKKLSIRAKVALASFVLFLFAGTAVFGIVFWMGSNSSEGTENDTQEEVLLAANLAVVEGDVKIKSPDEDRWMEALEGDTISQGDSVKTDAKSKAVLILDNGDAVRLNASSEVMLESMDPSAVVISQVNGETYNRVSSFEENTFTVKGQGVEAQALGTAYLFENDTKKSQVNVLVYESKVKLNTEDKEIKTLEKAVVDAKTKKVKVTEMSQKEYENEFAKWNRERDKKDGYQEGDQVGPKVTITSPKNNSATENETVKIEGKVTDDSELRKIKVNGEIYNKKNSKGLGFDTETGKFSVKVSLKEGKNKITVKAYDIYWNADSSSVSVTREVEEEAPAPAPQPTSYFYISNLTSPSDGKVSISWAISGYSIPSGFKVVWSKNANPVYPGSSYKYLSDSGARSKTIYGLSKGTWHFRVCRYNGSGQCLSYSNDKTVYVDNSSNTDYPSSINLSVGNPTLADHDAYQTAVVSGGYKVNLSWTSDKDAPNGFKVCYAKHSNPSYPNDTCKYLSSGGTRSYTISGLTSGQTYHFRVGAYKKEGGACEVYSNNVSKTMP